MKLRKQLFLLSLITLTLPWVGCQYIREMDQTLRQGQTNALNATAKAIASHLSNDSQSADLLEKFNADNIVYSLYAYILPAPSIVDGYSDDWIAQSYRQFPLNTIVTNPSIQGTYYAGIHDKKFYLFLHVVDDDINYYNPTHSSTSFSDHITLVSKANNQTTVVASAPGNIEAFKVNNGKEEQVKGFWRESHNGYQVELSFPVDWIDNGLGIRVFDQATQADIANFTADAIPAVVSPQTELEQRLKIFDQTGIKLYVSSARGYFLTSAGEVFFEPQMAKQHGLVEWIYSLALGEKDYPPLDNPVKHAMFSTPETNAALNGKPAFNWYRDGSKQLVRAAVPINLSDATIGAVIIEQSADSPASATNSAFNKLLIYTFLASILAAVTLVIYATWLSTRIRRLSNAAANAINESGKVVDHFPVFKSRDEIGDLSRSYAQLLTRLREYTNYLRTLSSKLSHELRTPLAIVRSSLDNLEHEQLPDQARIYAERAKEGTTRLSNILNAMSAASRVEQAIGAAELEQIPCDELLSSLREAYKDVYQTVNFELNIRRDGDKLNVLGSGELLVQMLDKLVDNAADFCPKGGLIELGIYRDNDHVVITVRNEGPPLPSHMHGQLFDSMVSIRDKGSPADKGHHLGLGLYIVRLIADFHQGEVSGYNIPDLSGVIFEVRLPAANTNSH